LHAEGFRYEAAFTQERGHAVELTRAALKAGFDLIVAVGGDGTLNEVVNGMLLEGGQAANPEAALGVISTGTGADFVRTAGIPRDSVEAATCLARATGIVPLDIAEMNYDRDGRQVSRYFANVAGMGFDAEVVERTERGGKRGGGTLPYLSTLIGTISTYRNKDVELCIDDGKLQERVNSIVICNGQYFGGGMRVGPNATLDDGFLDVILIGDMNTFEVLVNTPKIYNGTHLSLAKVSEYRARIVRVIPRQRMMIQADGELIGEGAATFRIHPAALKLRV
jgi:YegS/Rv2252/BmrU family lipid kinase